jgi:integrase
MPRPTQRPRLWLRKERRSKEGKLITRAAWFIVDRGKYLATGCLEGDAASADRKLAAYIAEKYQPERKVRDVETIDVADVLSIYFQEIGRDFGNQRQLRKRIERLGDFWGGKMLADVNGKTCREYADQRGVGGARRDLEDLRAAIRYHAKEGYHRGMVEVTLPPKGAARDRWLERSEAAKALWACWRHREVQNGKPTGKRPLRHLARFILIGLYTGTRAGAIASASSIKAEGRSLVDLDRGIFYRLAQGKKATNKRQPPAPIPARLLCHLRRWARLDEAAREAGEPGHEFFVEWHGQPVKSVKTAFARVNELLGLEDEQRISPHTLRHTAATWLMQAATPLWEAAGFLGMSEKTLRDVYAHHHPDHLKGAADRLGYRKTKRETLVISLGAARSGPVKKAVTS